MDFSTIILFYACDIAAGAVAYSQPFESVASLSKPSVIIPPLLLKPIIVSVQAPSSSVRA